MSLIRNLVKEPEIKTHKKKKDGDSDGSDTDDKKSKPVGPFIKSATDLQRLKLEKLMKNPEKLVIIPEQRRERDYMSSVPTFVRNVMGSSAGAGSGEFHVYRHLRRKEYARQKNIQNQSLREAADEAYQQKLDDNKRVAEERTAKKRAKRLKKKQRAKKAREHKPNEPKQLESESSQSESEAEEATAAESLTNASKEVDVRSSNAEEAKSADETVKGPESTETENSSVADTESAAEIVEKPVETDQTVNESTDEPT